MGERRRGARADQHGTQPLVTDVVLWSVQHPPVELVVGRWAVVALEGALDMVTAGGGAPELPRRPPRVPVDPLEPLDLAGPLTIRGAAPWLPRPALGPQHISANSHSACLDRTGHGASPPLPLPDLTVAAATCHDRYRRRRRASAVWSLEVTGPQARATITGPWLALAWLAHLAGWPEPGRAGQG
ncbi:hypothetical protein WDZ17_04370 [Pseudokineococcus basanitobsidens]|uniref:Uncharacterized protein n=1 Tax=Pseudokineococcus basanitobsidens TaxID=1926649 RepID=A0ABU8RHL5_9ACTN